MLNYILLFVETASITAQNLLRKAYSEKTNGVKAASNIFNLLMTLSATVVVGVALAIDRHMNLGTLVYSLSWGAAYASCVIFMYLAIQTGSLSLSALIVQFSLMIPTFFGVVFLKERLSVFGIIGLVLLVISMIGINIPKKGEKVSWKWFIFSFIAFVGNGVGGIMQKLHQIKYPGEYRYGFLFSAFIAVDIAMFFLLLSAKPKRDEVKKTVRSYGYLGVLSGVFNATVNILTMVLAAALPASVMFPIISAGGIVLTFIASVTIYRERLSPIGYVAYLLGTASVILLSL